MTSKKLSRRDFLRASAVTAAGAALAACQPQVIKETVEVEKVVEQTVEVPVAQTVEVVTEIEKTVVVEATAPPPEEATVIIFVGFGTGTSAEQIAVHEEIAEEFNAQSDMIKAEFLTSVYAENQAKFSTLVAAGTPPDICMPIGVGGVSQNFEAWADITPYVERDNYDLGVYFGATVDLHTHAGKGLLGLPIGVYPMVIFYNEDLFDAAGVDYPPARIGDACADGDAWTYDKLAEVAKQLTVDAAGNNADSPAFNWEETAQWGWNGWDWNDFKQFPQKWGGNNMGVSEDGKTAEMNTDAWVNAMEWNKDTIWTWHIRATGEQSGAFYDVAGDPMGSGLVGMWECHSWMAWAYPSWTEAFYWNVGAVPSVEGFEPCAPIHADTFVMLKVAHHPDQAWEVMKWMFEPEVLDRLAANYGAIPAHQELAAGWVDGMNEKFPDIDFAAFLDAIPYLDDPQHEKWTPEYSRVVDAVENALQLVQSGENTNVPEVMDNLNAEVQAMLDEYWATWG
jgi:multiple sugar transport system substrate-binding protein